MKGIEEKESRSTQNTRIGKNEGTEERRESITELEARLRYIPRLLSLQHGISTAAWISLQMRPNKSIRAQKGSNMDQGHGQARPSYTKSLHLPMIRSIRHKTANKTSISNGGLGLPLARSLAHFPRMIDEMRWTVLPSSCDVSLQGYP